MVKTRHQGDDDEDDFIEFMSLPAERSSRRNSRIGKSQDQAHDEIDGSDDPDYPQRDTGSRGAKMTRSGRVVARPGRLSPELVTNKRSQAKMSGKRGCSSKKKGRVEEYSDSDEEQTPQHETQSSSKFVNGSLENSGPVVRRSTRHRRLLYDTFNTSLIDRIQSATSFENGAYDHCGDRDKSRRDATENRVLTRRRRRTLEVDVNDLPPDEVEMDMYSKVKRTRQRVKRDMYGIPITEEGKSDEEEEEESSSDETDGSNSNVEREEQNEEENENEVENEEEDEEEEEEEEPPRKQYYLRENKPRTQIFDAGADIRYTRPKKFTDILGPHSPVRRKHLKVHKSPARRSPAFKCRRRAAFHGSSSTSSSSSSSSSSDDEERFQRRKAKSMAKARNRCLPMNMDRDDVAAGVMRDRTRIGSSLADVDPMAVDREINFESVGGLGKHVRALKEMIVFPLMYPEVFERFKIQPPRGVLFYGPPGTGKTLVARALANECSQGERKVAFFMRKGADCLSKWVGESERQLRLLFDQAYQMRPSIIFFDEIDGLAPVRSSRQDQIHSSIVSTLLALMDGLDSRGEIVVIGATNRIDSIDPALRRPGRFDREFLFPLPSLDARKQIIKIHTKDWNPKLGDAFISELAEKCVGYCGADVRALCTEAALFALRRRYPQIYTTNDKLQLDVSSININARDFHYGMQNIVPTAQRSIVSPGRGLSPVIEPLLKSMFTAALDVLRRIFPDVLMQLKSLDSGDDSSADVELYSDDEEDQSSIYDNSGRGKFRNKQNKSISQGSFLNFHSSSYHRPATHRPRLLLSGLPGQGQSSHLAPAILHHLEQLPVHVLDLPSLYAVSAKTPEESCAQIFREARRTSPSIIYLPHISHWWDVSTDTLRATFLTLLQDMEPTTPVLLLATGDLPYNDLSEQIHLLFDDFSGNVIHMKNPNNQARRDFFVDLFLNQATKPPSQKRKAAKRALEVLPKAPPPERRQMTEKEAKRLHEQEEMTLRELRLFLRDVINRLARDRKFAIFTKPVDVEEVEDYYEVIRNPMDLSTMMSKIDLHVYESANDFLVDIDLICSNALEYNPDLNPTDRAIRHRACALKDLAHSIVKSELDPDFGNLCEDIVASRERRGVSPTKSAPTFYHVRPLNSNRGQFISSDPSLPTSYPSRFSRRARGMDVEPESERCDNDSVPKDKERYLVQHTPRSHSPKRKKPRLIHTCSLQPKRIIRVTREQYQKLRRQRQKKSPWCRSTHKNRRRYARHYEIIDDEVYEDEKSDIEVEPDDEGADEKVDSDATEVQSPSPHPLRSPTGSKPNSPLGPGSRISFQANSPRGTRPHSPATAQSTSPGRAPPTRERRNSGADLELISEHSYSKSPDRSPRLDNSPRSVAVTEPLTIDTGNRNMPILLNEDSNKENDPLIVPLSPRNSEGGDTRTSTTRKRKRSESRTSHSEVDMDQSSPKVDINSGQIEENNSSPSSDNEITASPAMRITRSRLHNQQVAKAVDILDEPEKPFIVDQEALVKMLNKTVEFTVDYTVERLEKLHCLLSQCVFSQRLNYDKTELVQDFKTTLLKFTQHDHL